MDLNTIPNTPIKYHPYSKVKCLHPSCFVLWLILQISQLLLWNFNSITSPRFCYHSDNLLMTVILFDLVVQLAVLLQITRIVVQDKDADKNVSSIRPLARSTFRQQTRTLYE